MRHKIDKQQNLKLQMQKLYKLTLSFLDLVINSSESGGIFRDASRQACSLCEPDRPVQLQFKNTAVACVLEVVCMCVCDGYKIPLNIFGCILHNDVHIS